MSIILQQGTLSLSTQKMHRCFSLSISCIYRHIILLLSLLGCLACCVGGKASIASSLHSSLEATTASDWVAGGGALFVVVVMWLTAFVSFLHVFKSRKMWLLILFCIRRSECRLASAMVIFSAVVEYCCYCFLFFFAMLLHSVKLECVVSFCFFAWMNKKEKVVVCCYRSVSMYGCVVKLTGWFLPLVLLLFKTCLYSLLWGARSN